MRKMFRFAGQPFTVEIQKQGEGFYTGLSEEGKEDTSLAVQDFKLEGPDRFAGKAVTGQFQGMFHYADGTFFVHMNGRNYRLEEARADEAGGAGSGLHKSPMPGKVITVSVAPGDTVEADQTLLVVEAMKMENAIKSGVAGTVKSVSCKAGDLVQPEDVLVEVEPAES